MWHWFPNMVHQLYCIVIQLPMHISLTTPGYSYQISLQRAIVQCQWLDTIQIGGYIFYYMDLDITWMWMQLMRTSPNSCFGSWKKRRTQVKLAKHMTNFGKRRKKIACVLWFILCHHTVALSSNGSLLSFASRYRRKEIQAIVFCH